MIPGLVKLPGDACTAKWVAASGNQTFIGVDESLVSESTLPKCRVFANRDCIGK